MTDMTFVSLVPPLKAEPLPTGNDEQSNADSIEPKVCPACQGTCLVHLGNMIMCQQCAHQFSQIVFPIIGRKGGTK